MDRDSRSFFGQYSQLLKEWCLSAFCSATMDWMASKIPVRNGIFATLLSIGQLTITFYTYNYLSMLFGETQVKSFFLADNWLAYNTILLMSPTATQRLSSSYRKLHFILYGPGRIPVTPSDCASGNCNLPQTDSKKEPTRELAKEITMTQRISSQWKSTQANSATQK